MKRKFGPLVGVVMMTLNMSLNGSYLSGFVDDISCLAFSDRKSGESQGTPGLSGTSGCWLVLSLSLS